MGIFSKIGKTVGKFVNRLTGAEEAGDQNAALQREFAQTGVQWRVADAKKSGIHPLAALGANLHTAVPAYNAGSTLGDWASAGQNIGRAIHATRTPGQRMTAEQAHLNRAAVTRADLENDLLRTEIASNIATMNQPGTGPPMAAADASADLAAGDPEGGRKLTLPGGLEWITGPSTPAEAVEDEYSDIVGFLYGAGRSLADAPRNVRNWGRDASQRLQAYWQREIGGGRRPRSYGAPGRGFVR